MEPERVYAEERTSEAAHLAQAEDIVERHAKIAAGVGLIPLPFVDIVGATAVQISLVNKLCRHYSQVCSRKWTKSIVSSLIGSITANVATSSTLSFAKGIPVIGTVVGVAALPAFFGATTYAIGKVFIQHFESGGTVFTFDPVQMKEHFRRVYSRRASVRDRDDIRDRDDVVVTPPETAPAPERRPATPRTRNDAPSPAGT